MAVLAALPTAASGQDADLDRSITEYRRRMAVAAPRATVEGNRSRPRVRLAQDAQVIRPIESQPSLPERQALISQPYSTAQNAIPTPLEILAEIPDPRYFHEVFDLRLERVKSTAREVRVVKNYERVMAHAQNYMARLAHKRTAELSLATCIQRTLLNNYVIRASAYGPAISQADLVQAEAIFDAVFFLDANYGHTDTPAATWEGDNPQRNARGYGGGFRKLLPTGMRVETSLRQTGVRTTLEPKQNTVINPAWDTVFTASLTQPLLRGFGLDYNRSGIEIQRVNLKVSQEQFEQDVRDRLFQAEQAYWALARARRAVLITVESVAHNQVTLENMEARLGHDATPIEVNNARSRWQQSVVDFQNTVRFVRDAEDALKNIMNDPEFKLSEDVELIPTETPYASPLAIDQFAEVRTALDERSEIRQAKLAIQAAAINTARTKNETLPQLDLTFQYQVEGLRRSPDSSFDNLTTNRYNSYNVIVGFQVPLGQRADWANYQKARSQESQAVVRLQQVTDQVVLDVNNAVRALVVDWDNVPPALDAVIAADRNLRALQERANEVSPSFLETELSGVEQLANTRASLLRVIIDYNIAIVALETAKGTLLQYNNVVARDEPPRR